MNELSGRGSPGGGPSPIESFSLAWLFAKSGPPSGRSSAARLVHDTNPAIFFHRSSAPPSPYPSPQTPPPPLSTPKTTTSWTPSLQQPGPTQTPKSGTTAAPPARPHLAPRWEEAKLLPIHLEPLPRVAFIEKPDNTNRRLYTKDALHPAWSSTKLPPLP